MTQDYAKKPRPRAANKSKAKAKPKPQPKSQIPGWVWLLTGIALGAFIMFLSYLSDQPETQSSAAPSTVKPEKKIEAKKETPKPRFDFYQLLEEDQVDSPRTYSKPIERKVAPVDDSLEYLMQVGSFKQSADADRLRAELLMMNLDASIEEFKKRNNDRYYRVLVGPYPNRQTMGKDRSTLTNNKIDVWVITRNTDS